MSKGVVLLNKKNALYGVIILLVLIWLFIFMPTEIFMKPLITPEAYLTSKPSIELFNRWIIIVPSSSIIVYLLGIQIILMSFIFMKHQQKLWGLSLLFWGIGTILAGTSYQTLGFELKCSGQTNCLFTSWFELAYLFMTAISISLMAKAFAETFTHHKVQKYLVGYGYIALIIYTIILMLGSAFNNQIMISYELFTAFFMPLFLVFFIINMINYKANKNNLDFSFIILWLLFLVINVGYYIYFFLDITTMLYTNTGLWFSANDVLHVGLMIWFGYFYFKIKKELTKR